MTNRFFSLLTLLMVVPIYLLPAQDKQELDDNTRATLILDIAKYVEQVDDVVVIGVRC